MRNLMTRKLLPVVLTLAMLITTLPLSVSAAEKPTFTDVKGDEYYAAAADVLSQLNIMEGYPDGTFGAKKDITRAEIAVVILRSQGLEEEANKAKGTTRYTDVPAAHWASGYINEATALNIIQGDGDGRFRPEDKVKYEEAIKIVTTAVGYSDASIVAGGWPDGYIKVAQANGILKNVPGSKGIASARGAVALLTYQGLLTQIKAPVASVKEGEYSSAQKIALTTETKDAKIYYTTDGTTPTVSSTLYSKEILLSKTTTLKAITVKSGVLVSDVFSAKYTISISSGGGGGGPAADRTAPTVSLEKTGLELENGIIQTTGDAITIRGTAIDNEAVKSVNCINETASGEASDLAVSGLNNFEITIPLAVGGNNITVSAKDSSNNTGAANIYIDRLSTEVTFGQTLKTTNIEDTRAIYDSIIEIWYEGQDTEDYQDDYTCVLMTEASPLVAAIKNNKISIGDTYVIPQCEQFVMGFMGTVEAVFESDDAIHYPASEYEAVRFSTPSLDALFGDNVRLDFSGGIDEENPIAFILLPDGTEYTSDGNGEISLMAAHEDFNSPGWQPKELVKGLIPTYSESTDGNQNATDLLVNLNDVVIYDGDGKILTDDDQITVGGQFGIKDLKYTGGIEWYPSIVPWNFDLLPQQVLSKTTYETVSNLKAEYKADTDDASELVEALNTGFKNKQNVFNLFDIQGVKVDKRIFLASFGLRLATPPVIGNIKSISDQSVAIPINPILVLSLIMDFDGSVKGEATFTLSYDSYHEEGFNLQKKNFSGAYGSLSNNLGQKSYQLPLNRQLEIFDVCGKSASKKNEKPSLEVKLEGSAEYKYDVGVGGNAGVMIAGIMPANVSGVVFCRTDADFTGNITFDNEGFAVDGDASYTQGLGLRFNGDLRLIAKGFNWEGGLEKSFAWERMFQEGGASTTKLEGSVTSSDDDRDNSNNSKIENATVTLIRTDNGTAQPRSTETDANGHYEFSNVLDGTYELEFDKNGYTAYTATDISVESSRTLDVVLDTLYENMITGKITIADDDTNDINNASLDDATVTVTKVTGSQQLTKSAQTGSDGKYSIVELPAGIYTVSVEKTDYIPITQFIIIKQGQLNYYNATLESIPDEYAGSGYASGVVYDVLTGNGVADLTLKIRLGLNNTDSGSVADTLTTLSDGSYTTGSLPAGNYCIQILDERSLSNESDRYLPNLFNIKILGNKTIPAQNGVVTNTLDANQLRIVLKWGLEPADLDSHLIGPTADSGLFHIYYANKTLYESDIKMADLDLDDTTSYGPETTTIYNPVFGKYRFYVHDYSNRGEGTSNALANSGAYVQVFHGASPVPIYTFNVPQGDGTLWSVFEYDSVTSQITPINEMSYELSPENVGLMSLVESETIDEYVELIFNDILQNEKDE